MNTALFLDVYKDSIRRRGLDPDVVTLSAAEQENVATAIERWTRYAWRSEWWPELMRSERRQCRATWAAGTTYAVDAEVYYTDGTDEGYFVSLAGTNLGNEPSFDGDTAWWAAADEDFESYIAFEQSWETTTIERLDPTAHVFEENPLLASRAAPVEGCRVFQSRLYLTDSDAPVRPWLMFMPKPPRFTRVAYAAGTTYAAGALVYGSDGDCYLSLQAANVGHTPASSPTWWAKQEFPEMFRQYVKDAVFAEWLRDEEARERAMRDAKRELESVRSMHMVSVSPALDVGWEN